MKKRVLRTFLFTVLLFGVATPSTSTVAATKESVASQKKLKKKKRKKKRRKRRAAKKRAKLSTQAKNPVAKEMSEPFFKPSFRLRYTVGADFNGQQESRTYTHHLGLETDVAIKGYFSVFALGNLFFQTQGQSILDDESSPSGELGIGVLKNIELPEFFFAKHSASPYLGWTSAIGDRATFEGINGFTDAGIRSVSVFKPGWYSLVNQLNFRYIANEFEFSPSTLQTNQDYSLTYKMSHTARFLKHFSFTLGLSGKYSHFINGSSNFSFGNSQTLGVKYEAFVAAITYSNGGHSDRDDFNLWFIDRTQQRLSLSLGYSF